MGLSSGEPRLPFRLHHLRRRKAMTAFTAALLLALSSCGRAPGAGSTSSASASASARAHALTDPTATRAVVTGRGYSIRAPSGWVTTLTNARWAAGHRPDPGVTGFDLLRAPDDSAFLAIGLRRIPNSLSLVTWTSQLTREGALNYSECGPAVKWSPETLGGQLAWRRPLPCPAHGIDAELLLTVHRSRGWAVMCGLQQATSSAVHSTCGRLLSTLRFTK